MGEVYLAVDTLLHRQVAIKVIDTDLMYSAESDATKEAARLFLREAQAIAQLDQANILPLYDSGDEHVGQAALMYMVMPYRQAGSLSDWLEVHLRKGLLPLAAVERIVSQAALALQHAHDRQIIHQDVKPSNFLVQGDAEHPSQLNLQLMDFGVARYMLKTSESQSIRGTPAYMAPEQWEGHAVPATDQYALAVMAYELLTGCLPLEGDNFYHWWHQHRNVMPVSPGTVNSSLPRELDAVLLRALAKNPEERYPSISAFAQAFTRVVIQSGNIYQTITINPSEIWTGTNRVLTLPDGKQVRVPIPQGVYHGQIIRFEGYGKPTTYNGPKGALILTIAITPVEEGFSHSAPTLQQSAFTPDIKREARPTVSAVSTRKSSARGGTILKICTALLLLTGVISLFFFAASGAIFHDGMSPMTTATSSTQQNCPYPDCNGARLALYNQLKSAQNTSQSYSWIPPQYVPLQVGACQFQGGALHASVDGNNDYTVRFHLCGPDNPTFSDFTFQVKMTFIKGDCGGVFFHSIHRTQMFYYFYICQSVDPDPKNVCPQGKYEYGLVRHKMDPPSGEPDTNVNPLLQTGCSLFNVANSNQANIIAVLTRGSNIGLYVNQKLIYDVPDPTGYNEGYRDGAIGVFAKAFALYRPTEVAFSDATVWKL
jgi:serine/threonine protein kinase